MLHKLKSAYSIRKNPTLNKCVFECFAKVAGPTVRSLKSTGNSFQQLGIVEPALPGGINSFRFIDILAATVIALFLSSTFTVYFMNVNEV